jgi:hypothetical protein
MRDALGGFLRRESRVRDLRRTLRLEPKGAVMPGSHAAEIIELFQSSDDWPPSAEDEAEPELDLPPLPPPRPSAA